MSRVKRGVTSHAKHKKVYKAAKGYYGRRKNTIRIAKQAVEKAGQYAYRDRKNKKRDFRKLWIIRINAACRMRGMRYSEFIHGLQRAMCMLDRKSLSEIAIHDPATFDKLVELMDEDELVGWIEYVLMVGRAFEISLRKGEFDDL